MVTEVIDKRTNGAIKAMRFIGQARGLDELSDHDIDHVCDTLAYEVGALRARMKCSRKPDFRLDGPADAATEIDDALQYPA